MHLNLILEDSNFIEMHGHTYSSFKKAGEVFFWYMMIYFCPCTLFWSLAAGRCDFHGSYNVKE